MVSTEQSAAVIPNPQDRGGAFTLFDLLFLLTRDVCLVGCAIVGWQWGGWYGAFACVPIGWVLGWAMRYAVAFLLAVVFKLLFGGTLWRSATDQSRS